MPATGPPYGGLSLKFSQAEVNHRVLANANLCLICPHTTALATGKDYGIATKIGVRCRE